ncbi:MAG TPA: hypothetical protein PKA53_05595 [Sphingobacterium sp.]|nr:hypothetical protein [Sphingobacterium sp.]
MKIYALYFLLFAVTYVQSVSMVSGQVVHSDSISNIEYAVNWPEQKIYKMATENSVWIKNVVKNDFNKLEAGGVFNKGSWIDAQGASKVRALDLSTEGKTTWNAFHIWGRFDYSRQLEDSTRLRHQTRINEDAPMYFGSLRNNYYERDVYNLDAGIQRSFARDKIPVTLGLDYRVGNHFSNNDPRGRVQDFQFNTALAFGFVKNNWSTHVKGIYGYGRERVGIGFKNDKYIQNTADPLYVNWTMYGFGNAFEQIRDITYNNDMDRYGISLHLHRSFGEENTLFVNVSLIDETQLFKRYQTNELTYDPLNEYQRKNYLIDLLWHRYTDENRNAVYTITAGIIEGRDYNYTIFKNNYVYRKEFLTAESTWSMYLYQLSINLNYQNISSKDGLTANMLEYSHFKPIVRGIRKITFSNQNELLPAVHIGYNWVLSKDFLLPVTNSGVFTKTILYHDYLYQTTSSMLGGLSMDYLIKSATNFDWKLGLEMEYIRRGEYTPYTYDIPSIPGNDRFNTNFSFVVFF